MRFLGVAPTFHYAGVRTSSQFARSEDRSFAARLVGESEAAMRARARVALGGGVA